MRDTAANQVLTEQRRFLPGTQSPVPFELRPPRERLRPGQRLEVRGALQSQGWARWLSQPLFGVVYGDCSVSR